MLLVRRSEGRTEYIAWNRKSSMSADELLLRADMSEFDDRFEHYEVRPPFKSSTIQRLC